MRPIRLRFAGLHSYRETQEVDFEELCETGLFGIFGPTGSGKSTILDAITLALYARVERAGGTRQGILNESEESLFVDFTFELGTGQDRRTYQVERRYRRSGDNSVNVTHARLTVTHDDVSQVIADKDSDVTTKIEEILGLKHEDFTRAVVLPQGKFAAFLTMRGADRRQMLERLFSLEAYGQRLMDRISKRRQATEKELACIRGGQAELGDASQEAVEHAQEAVVEATRQAQAARTQLDKGRQAYKQAEKQRSLQEELEQIRRELRPLEAAAPEIERARKELDLAEAAEPIRRELQTVAEAEERRAAATERLARAREQLEQAMAKHLAAEEAFVHAERARREEQPALLARRAQLEQALDDEAALDESRRQIERLRTEMLGLTRKVDELGAQLEETQKSLARDEAVLHAKQKQLLDATIDPDERQRIDAAMKALERWEEAQASVTDCTAKYEHARAALQAAERDHRQAQHVLQQYTERITAIQSDLRQLEEAPPTDEESRTATVRFIERMRGLIEQIDKSEKELERSKAELEATRGRLQRLQQEAADTAPRIEAAKAEAAAAEAAVLDAQRALQRVNLSHQAAALARELVENAPCPVCGSTHHPAPAAPLEARDEEAVLAEAQARQRTCEQHLSELQQSRAVLQSQLEDAVRALSQQEEAIERGRSGLRQLRADLPPEWQPLTLDELQERLQSAIQSHTEQEDAAREWQDKVAKLRKALDAEQRGSTSASQSVSDEGERLARAQAIAEQAEQALKHAQETVVAAEKAFWAAAGELSPESVRQRAHAITAADRAAKSLRAEIEQLDQSVKSLHNNVSSLQDERTRTERLLDQNRLELKHATAESEKLSERVKALTGGERVGVLLEQVQTRLTQLEADESRTRTARDVAAAERTRCEQDVAVTQDQLNRSLEDVQTAQAALSAQLNKAGFSSADAATEALRSPERRAELRERLESHRQRLEHLTTRRNQLEQQLAGDWIDDEQWAVVTEAVTAAEKAHEAALKAQSVAENELRSVEARHKKWKSLEAQRQELQRLKDRLDQLQTLCRGNQFVEFVAEEYLAQVAANASVRLGQLTRNRYALEVDSGGGFVIRDDANGGVRRPVSSLSGGETFVTSLALALALSNQIQLHGTYPLEFFFLDEGFGTLDPELLETVMTSLERLRSEHVSIGIISHVPELRQRVARRLIVHPANVGENGSRLTFERA